MRAQCEPWQHLALQNALTSTMVLHLTKNRKQNQVNQPGKEKDSSRIRPTPRKRPEQKRLSERHGDATIDRGQTLSGSETMTATRRLKELGCETASNKRRQLTPILSDLLARFVRTIRQVQCQLRCEFRGIRNLTHGM